MQKPFIHLSDYLYVRVWCEPSNLSNNQISATLEFLVVCNNDSEDASIKTVIGGRIRAFKLVVGLGEIEQRMLRNSFYLLDQISTFYHTAYHSNSNTGKLVYTSASFENRNQFCVPAAQTEGISKSLFVLSVTTAGDNIHGGIHRT